MKVISPEIHFQSASFDCARAKLVGMFFGIVPMFVQEYFVWDCAPSRRYARAKMCVRAGIRAYYICATKRRRAKSLSTNIGTIDQADQGTCLPILGSPFSNPNPNLNPNPNPNPIDAILTRQFPWPRAPILS